MDDPNSTKLDIPQSRVCRWRNSKASSMQEQKFSDLMKDLRILSETQWGMGGMHTDILV